MTDEKKKYDWREERDLKRRKKPLYKKCQNELIKMFERLLKKNSPLITKYEIIDGVLYFKSGQFMCEEGLKKRIRVKIKSVTGTTGTHLWIDETKKMTGLEFLEN